MDVYLVTGQRGEIVGRIIREPNRRRFLFFPGSENEIAWVWAHEDPAELILIATTRNWREELFDVGGADVRSRLHNQLLA